MAVERMIEVAGKAGKTSMKKQRGEDRFTASPVEFHNVRKPKQTKRGK